MFASNKKKFGVTLGVLLSVSLLIYACGGGGGSSSSGSTGTVGSKSAATSTTATTSSLNVTHIGLSGGLSGKPILTKSSFGGSTKAWQAVLKAKANQKLHKLGTTTNTCSNSAAGGTSSDTTAYDPTTKTLTTTHAATNCVTDLKFTDPTTGQTTNLGSMIEDGTLVVKETASKYTGSDPTTNPSQPLPNNLGDPAWDPDTIDVSSTSGASFTMKNAGGVVTLMFKLTGGVTTQLVLDAQGRPTSGSLTSTMSLEFQDDNGTPTDATDDTHEVVSLSNFSDTMTFLAWDTKGDPTHIVDTIASGTIGVNDLVNSANNVVVSFTNFKVDETVTIDPTTKVETDTITISGQINTACLGGAVTIATPTPIVVVGDACPTSGVITVASATNTATVTFTNGAVDITNSDGSASQHFAKCDEATAC